MRLPKDILSGNYKKPRIFLCEANKDRICQLETVNTKGTFKFNSYSELSFDVGRMCQDMMTGYTYVNPFYDKIEALRLIEVEGIGFFEIQGPKIVSDGIMESKTVTAYSYEYTLSQKYLENFYINTGEVDSREVINASSEKNIVPVTLYNPSNPGLSLLHLIFEKNYAGWKVGHIDQQLTKLSRKFEVERQSIYDFLMNEVCEKFNCYIVFDVKRENNGNIAHTINLYAGSPVVNFTGDGKNNKFKFNGNPFSEVKTVSIDGYKTSQWRYEIEDGLFTLILDEPPEENASIEVVGVDSTWETDVFVSFENLANEVNIDYDADDIKTVLYVTFGDDNSGINEVNLGMPYIADLSYYTDPEWMGQELYDKWISYQKLCNSKTKEYAKNTQDMLDLQNKIDYEENRTSLGYAKATVDETTVGTYYVRGGTYPNYYYTEVSLPGDYNVNKTYYSMKTTNIEDGGEGNIHKFYEALKKYFTDAKGWKDDLEALDDEFSFIYDNVILDLLITLSSVEVSKRTESERVEREIEKFLYVVWKEFGRNMLKNMNEIYMNAQVVSVKNGESVKDNEGYGKYYAIILMLNSINRAISERSNEIVKHEQDYYNIKAQNTKISNQIVMTNHFSDEQLATLNSFLREDELHIYDIVYTQQDSIKDTFRIQQNALESARVELDKISQPQLKFSMTMANIYALPEFEPIIDQFALGNMIKVAIRPNYIKQSRLMQVDINFDDFSDFSCEFGDLMSLRTQSDLHADLLKNAITAGKSVAQNAGYWTQGSNTANSIDERLKEGLLNSIDALKSIDGTQNAYIDKYGIHLEAVNPETGEIDDKRVWLVNNQIVFTDDGFKTSKTALGEYVIDGETYWGLLAQAVIAGLIEGSTIIGGTIRIGEYIDEKDGEKKYKFEVDESGNVTMNASSISGYVTSEEMEGIVGNISSSIEQTATDITTNVNNSIEGVYSQIEQTADSITSTVSQTYATKGQALHYGTCSSSASSKAKIVSCSGFSLYTGATISVRFTNANSVASPTLNVNSTGAKEIRAYNSALSADSDYNWAANSVVLFVYDGTYWRISDSGTLSKTITLSTKIEQTEEKIELEATRAKEAEYTLSSKITVNANNITSEVKRAKEQESSLSSKITQNANSITSEVTRAKNAESALGTRITQTESDIKLKVNSGDLGTLIEQNASKIKLAWNQSNKYIQFESDGSMNVYTSGSTYNDNTRLMKQAYNGTWYYYKGTTLGKIGTNSLSGHDAYRGLVFDLEYKAGYMCWAAKEASGDTSYSIQFSYSSGHDVNGKDVSESVNIGAKGLHVGCTLYGHNNLFSGVCLDNVSVMASNGVSYKSYSGKIPIVMSITPDGSGGFSYETTNLIVSNGIITGYSST